MSVQPGLRGSNYLRVGRKMATFQLFFQSREQVVVRRGRIRRIGWVIKTLEVQVGQFLLGCKCPVIYTFIVLVGHLLFIIETAHEVPPTPKKIALAFSFGFDTEWYQRHPSYKMSPLATQLCVADNMLPASHGLNRPAPYL